MAIQNQGYRRDLNLSETTDDEKALDNLMGTGISNDLRYLQNNLRNIAKIPFNYVDSNGFFSFDVSKNLPISSISAKQVGTQNKTRITIVLTNPYLLKSGNLVSLEGISGSTQLESLNGQYSVISVSVDLKTISLDKNNIGNIVKIRSTVNNGNDPNLHFEKGRGGAGTTASVQDNDDLGDIQWKGYDGNSYEIGARIMGEVEGTPSDGDMPTRLVFMTRAQGTGTPLVKMHIGANGNVGIGLSNPSEKLHVSGNILATGTITPNSDIAFKKDIEPLTNVLNKITQLIGVNFKYKDNNQKSMGLLAQDVEKVFPELIQGEEGEKSLNYMGLTGAIVEAIKELSDKVTKLEGA